MMKHSNLSIFVPHIGCPNKCSFCNQNSISGAKSAPTPDDVRVACTKAIEDLGKNISNAQIAFFGGSFTAINREYMLALLEAANEFIGKNKFKSIRISTRPDCINTEILAILKKYNVGSIELGVQSMSEEVLKMNHRGHNTLDVYNSAELIKEYGFELGLQMMVGLYGDTPLGAIETANAIAKINPATVRIYPTVVIKDTLLAELFEQGKYEPMELWSAVEVCSRILEIFIEKGIKVIRLGLHASTELEGDMLGGIYHPAFRELCEGEIMLRHVTELLDGKKYKNIIIFTSPSAVSKMTGQKKRNIKILEQRGFKVKIKEDKHLKGLETAVYGEINNATKITTIARV